MRTTLLSALLLFVSATMLILPTASAERPDVIDLGSKRELFVDYFLIEKMDGTELRMHAPQPAEIVLRLDRPWEGLFCGYFTVLKDGDLYRMYYRGMPKVGENEVACLAESEDGIEWKRPNLGLHEVNGTTDNNVILRGEGCHNFSPFIDTRPGVPKTNRYKALGRTKGGLAAYVSHDGVHWSKLHDHPVLTHKRHGEFDSQNVAFWSETENTYVCYYRKFTNDVRWIGRATSDDFIQWSDGEIMTIGVPSLEHDNYYVRLPNGRRAAFNGAPYEHFYTNQTHPYFRAPHIYLSFPMRFRPRQNVLSQSEARKIAVHPNYGNDASDGVFMTTRGGTHYDLTFPGAFFRPGLDPGNWVSRTNMAALGVVPTGPGEISIYYSQHYAQPTHHIQRFTLRTDGFISVNAPYAGGEMTTKPFCFDGNTLTMNYSTSAAGTLRVELQDKEGKAIPGFSLEECPAVIGDRIDGVITWENGADVSKLAGKPIRLRLFMRDADVYSFRFVDNSVLKETASF